jgi:hypothetical protein
MNLALRGLGWAIRVFWIITLAVAITCVYSATQISVELGEVAPFPNDAGIEATLPITLNNRGYYRIADLNVTTAIRDIDNRSLSEKASQVAEISSHNEITILHSMELDMNVVLSQAQYLFNDSELQLRSFIRLSYANLIPVSFEMNTEIPWGAPLANFTAGAPEYSFYDFASQSVTVPISFQNNSPYMNVTGTIHVEIFSSQKQLLGEDTLPVDVPSGRAYSGEAEVLVHVAQGTPTGEIHLRFDTDTFHYGPMVIAYGQP